MIQHDLTGKTIKGYELRERIGAGGFGAVYRAYQPLVKREVAIKVILPLYANEPAFIRRFEAEAQLIANLEHIHIVPLYDFWRDADGAFLVMRWLRGGSVQDVLKKGHWPLSDIPRVLDQIAGALAVAHHNGVVHRDIKPENILLDEDKNAYLVDFGIAKDLNRISDNAILIEESEGEQLVGSPDFMSPEQIQLAKITPQSDIYSLGIVVYMLLTGHKPFAGSDLSTVISKHLYEPIPNIRDIRPDLPDALQDVINNATHKIPDQRYGDVLDFALDFRNAMQQMNAQLIDMYESQTLPGFDVSEIEHYDTIVPDIDHPTQTISPVELDNPYKGLRAFGEVDADDFYGRAALVESLVNRMTADDQQGRFLAIVGPSGSGKSSLVRAGLLPALRRGDVPNSDSWFITDMVPGTHPIEELEAALLRIAVNPPSSLTDQLERDERGLVRAVKRVLPGGDDADTELVLLIDQFEELFTQVESESVRTHFLASLLAAAEDPNSRLRVIVTLRADFYDRPLIYPEFGMLVRECTELVLPLSQRELQDAIVLPAENAGLRLEEGVVAAILADVNQQPGMLPLMQYALTELFERRNGADLSLTAYQEIGGVSGALARRADELLNALEASAQQIAQQIFLRLVTLGDGSEDTRRRVFLGELLSLAQDTEQIQAVLDRFGKFRLLTFDHDPATRNPTVEIAHEALIRQWTQLRDWLDDSRDDLRMQRRIATAAREWQNANHEPSFLASGARLAQFEEWRETTRVGLNEIEQQFLEASLEMRTVERQAEAARQAREAALERRSRNVLRALAGVMAIAAAFGLGLSLFAFDQRNAARENAVTATIAQGNAVAQAATAQYAAEIAALNARDARRLALISGSRASLAENDTDLALLLGVEAATLDDPTRQTRVNLAQAAYEPGMRQLFVGHTDRVQAVAYSPDGSQILSAGDDNILIVWDAATGELIQRLEGHRDWVWDVAFSPDGTQALSASRDMTLILWDVVRGVPIHIFDGHEDEVQAVDFSPDGLKALSGSHDETLIHWDLETGEVIAQLGLDGSGHSDRVYDVDYSRGGFTAVSGSEDGSVIVWNLNTGQPLFRYQGENGGIWSVKYTPDEFGVVTGAFDGSLVLWSFETGEATRQFVGHTDRVTGVDFGPDGAQIISSSQDDSLILWDFATGQIVKRYIGHTNRVYDVAFSPQGGVFTSASWDQTLRTWDTNNGAQLEAVNVHHAEVFALAIADIGGFGASGDADGGIVVWDTESGDVISQWAAHQDAIGALAFMPDGKRLISGGGDNLVIEWDAETGNQIRQFGLESGGHSDDVLALAVSPDGQQIASGARDNTLILWNTDTGEQLQRLFEHRFHILSLDYRLDGSRILSASRDNRVLIWNAETGSVTREFDLHDDWVFTAKFSPDGERVLSGGAENELIYWDVASGQPLQVLAGHDTFIYNVTFSPSGRYAASSSADGVIILWDLETFAEVQRFDAHTDEVRAVEFISEDRLVSASGDQTVRLWQVITNLEGLLEWIAENRVLREYQCSERVQYEIAPLCPTPTPIFDPSSI